MDDARIQQLTSEVMAQLGGKPTPLELAQRALVQPKAEAASAHEPTAVRVVAVAVTIHPSHQHVDVPSGGSDGRCVLEPGRACCNSGQCRTLGH